VQWQLVYCNTDSLTYSQWHCTHLKVTLQSTSSVLRRTTFHVCIFPVCNPPQGQISLLQSVWQKMSTNHSNKIQVISETTNLTRQSTQIPNSNQVTRYNKKKQQTEIGLSYEKDENSQSFTMPVHILVHNCCGTYGTTEQILINLPAHLLSSVISVYKVVTSVFIKITRISYR